MHPSVRSMLVLALFGAALGLLLAACATPGPEPSTLTVTVEGNGTVTSDPAGVDCGATCTASFEQGSAVLLTAAPGERAAFVGWTGDACAGETGPTCSVILTDDRSVTATFVATGNIEGYVVDQRAGTAVEGTRVSLVGTERGAVTDETGFYRIEGVAPGEVVLEFRQMGFAEARVEGLEVAPDTTTHYHAIQLPAFDPSLPAAAPLVTVGIEDGATVVGAGDANTFDVVVSTVVADPQVLAPYVAVASLGQEAGTDPFLNEHLPVAIDPANEAEITIPVLADGFAGATTLHVVVYDNNYNRTEVIVDVTVDDAPHAAVPRTPIGLAATAVTLGDVAAVSRFGVDPRVAAAMLLDALQGEDDALIRSLDGGVSAVEPLQGIPGPDPVLDKVVTWVDLTFTYPFDPAGDGTDLPAAFEVFRSLAGGEFVRVARVPGAMAHVGSADDPTRFAFRDAGAGLRPGIDVAYRVEAVTDDARSASDVASTTPLPPFFVDAAAPRDDEKFVSVLPTYQMEFFGSAEDVYVGVVVLDRVHSGGLIEWALFGLTTAQSELLEPFGGHVSLAGAAIPHNVDLGAATELLQPYHAYDWSPVAATFTDDEEGNITAVSIASDYFDLFGVGVPASDAPFNTFVTGDGSF